MIRSLLAVGILAAAALAEPAGAGDARAPADDEDALVIAGKRKLPGLKLEFVANGERHELGEPIDVLMEYTYAGRRKLAVTVVRGDRSGRILDFRFTAEDAEGVPVRDPLAGWTPGFCGGPRGSRKLAPGGPYGQKVTLNEWLCFDRPGRYSVKALSHIVMLDDHETGRGGPAIPLESEPVEIVIVPPVDARRVDRLERAKEDLRSDDRQRRRDALRDLRFMVDERAIPLLVRALEDQTGYPGIEAEFGLMSFRDPEPVRREILRILQDDGRFIMPGKLGRYTTVLTAFEMRVRGTGRGYVDQGVRREIWRRLREPYVRSLERKLDKLPPAKAAAATLEAFARGPMLPRSEARHWKRILDVVGELDREYQQRAGSQIEMGCRIKEFIPDLRRVARDRRLDAHLRSTAIVAAHAMGDESLCDLVFDDITAEKPVLSMKAHATLGEHGADEVAGALFSLLDSPSAGVRRSAAGRLRDFGGALPAERMREVLLRHVDGDPSVRHDVLKALAMKSPRDALPFVREIVRDPRLVRHWLRNTAIEIASRSDLPEAQEVVLEILRSKEEADREAVARALYASWHEGKNPSTHDRELRLHVRPRRRMPPDPDFAAAFVPELLQLFKTDESGKVRVAARDALAAITCVPGRGLWHATRAQEKKCLPEWEAWWRVNGACYGRWGRPALGLAVKCSAGKGEHRQGEEITLTVRVRRTSVEAAGEPSAHLHATVLPPGSRAGAAGAVYDRGIPGPGVRVVAVDRGENVLPGPRPGDEASYRVRIRPAGGADDPLAWPGKVGLSVRYVTGSGGKTRFAESAPVAIHIRAASRGGAEAGEGAGPG